MNRKRTDSQWLEYCAAMLILGSLLFAASVALADEYDRQRDNPDIVVNSNNTRTIDRSQENNSEANADSTSNSEAGAAAESTSAGGTANVTTKSENTSLVLTGARDTAGCFTKVTIGAEGFGIGFSRSDPYCKKVRLITRQLALQNWDAAARLECTLKEWREIYGKDKEACRAALFAGPDEEPVNALIEHQEYSALAQEFQYMIVAQVQQEEFNEAVEKGEYRYAQQQALIEELNEEHAKDDKEIARLKRETAEAAKRETKELARRAAARAALQKEDI